MNIIEALKLVREGKHVGRRGWPEDHRVLQLNLHAALGLPLAEVVLSEHPHLVVAHERICLLFSSSEDPIVNLLPFQPDVESAEADDWYVIEK